MFWKKKKNDSTAVAERGPQDVPQGVQDYLIKQLHIDSDYAPLFRAVMRKGEGGMTYIRLLTESNSISRNCHLMIFRVTKNL